MKKFNTIIINTEFKGYTVNGNGKFKVKISNVGQGFNFNIIRDFLTIFNKKKLNDKGCIMITDYKQIIIEKIEKICKIKYNNFIVHNIEL